jgi:hypothetical protein
MFHIDAAELRFDQRRKIMERRVDKGEFITRER